MVNFSIMFLLHLHSNYVTKFLTGFNNNHTLTLPFSITIVHRIYVFLFLLSEIIDKINIRYSRENSISTKSGLENLSADFGTKMI
jgi:hypothetical protein